MVFELFARSFISFLLHLTRNFHCTHANFQSLHALSKLLNFHYWDLCWEVYIRMAVADVVSAWLVAFIAPILYHASQYAIRKRWHIASSGSVDGIDEPNLATLNTVVQVIQH